MPDTTSFSDLYETMRAVLGDRQVHGNWHYQDATLLSAARALFITGRQPAGYQLAGDNPFSATAFAPALKLGDDAALIVYDACLTLVGGEDGALSFVTRSLSVNDKGERKSDLMWELRGRVDDIRNGGAVWATYQSFAQFIGALPHEPIGEGILETEIGLSDWHVNSPIGDIVI